MKRLFLIPCLLAVATTSHFARSTSENRPQKSSHPFCGTTLDRVQRELQRSRDLRMVRQFRAERQALSTAAGATQDMGQIAVMEDDGTIVTAQNPFDLPAVTLRLSPAGSGGSYLLSQRQETVGSNLGTALTLTDDDSREIVFSSGFSFAFFGTTYSSVFINSDGNLTFGEADNASTDRNLTRFNAGPPRIGGFFADFDPTAGSGGVFYNALPDRFVVTWDRVREYGGTTESSFQATLFADGAFELIYGGISAQSGISGWSGGRNNQTLGLADLSASAGVLFSGPRAERFARSTELDLPALAAKFYQTHGDEYDQLVMFTNFPFDLEGAFAFELNIKNEIRGIGLEQFDFSSDFSSSGRLQSFLAMNQLTEFPDDPDTVFFGTNSTINILGQEAGHRWLAYVRFRNANGQNSTSLLGRDDSHWSFFFNSEASVMEGNQIEDRSDGNFETTAATDRYSKLDQYLMGFREPSQVGPMFYVSNISGTTRTPSSAPTIGVTFRGTRQNVTVDDIIAAEGPRIPTVAASPKVFKQAFVLLVQRGTAPSGAEVAKLDRFRQRWQEFFSQATNGLGSADTTLSTIPIIPTLSSVAPASGPTAGNTPLYISGNNFQDGVSVRVGSNAAVSVQRISSTLVRAVTPPSVESIASVVVTNPGAQPATLGNAFSYVKLNPASVSSGAVRLAFAIDSPTFRSNLGVNNPSPQSADVRVLHLDRNGLLVNQLASLMVPPNGFAQRNSILRELEGSASITGREGTLALESSQQIQAFVSQIDNQTGDPSILEGFRQGSTRIILSSAANTGPFRSNLIVVNLAPSEARVNIRPLDRDSGQPVGAPVQNLTLPANGFVSHDNILASLNVNDYFGPVEIRSTNGTELAAVSRVSGLNAGTSGFFPALPADSGQLAEIIPFAIDTNEFRTNLGINNLGTTNASVNVTFFEADGALLASTASPVSVVPQGLVQINNVLRFLLAGSSNASVTNRQGYLKLTSNSPIKAFATQIDNLTNDPSIENSVSSGSANLLLKSTANTSFRSTLAIVNPNASPVSVQITAREGSSTNNGAATGTRIITIPPNGQFVSQDILSEIGASSTFGPVEMRSLTGSPIIAVSRVYNITGNTSGFFNAQPLP
ncbi:MAG: IPT/TIG domain-containing protein [Acidobacteria bacterium]|nr:IPT/TIG domain-containing protein [Acidobacteriota bacterium]MCI0625106.1 IPT/TIG domain-containing protein [Acidobacteriota bacterium]MCI0718957.1 IPT/TIG domain-containing protein [Acidobacteriota bacterium]